MRLWGGVGGVFSRPGLLATAEEAAKLYELLSENKSRELSDEELEGVAGGAFHLYYDIKDCPRGYTKWINYWVWPDDPAIVLEGCKDCKYLEVTEGDDRMGYDCLKRDKTLRHVW